MFIFVFPSEGCAIALGNQYVDERWSSHVRWWVYRRSDISCIFSFCGGSVSVNISGGHVNPAVTFGVFLGGHISSYKSIWYWIAQLLGSVTALFLLKVATGGLDTSSYALRGGETP
ncbi:hypothetical protein P3S67_003448 [Capsicum chacoense]